MRSHQLRRTLSLLTVFLLLMTVFALPAYAGQEAANKPVIGISWAYDDQAEEYAYYKAII